MVFEPKKKKRRNGGYFRLSTRTGTPLSISGKKKKKNGKRTLDLAVAASEGSANPPLTEVAAPPLAGLVQVKGVVGLALAEEESSEGRRGRMDLERG